MPDARCPEPDASGQNRGEDPLDDPAAPGPGQRGGEGSSEVPAETHDLEPLPELPGERRRVLALLAGGIGAVATGSLIVPWLRIFFDRAERMDSEVWAPVGGLEEFAIGKTTKVTYRDPTPLPWAGFVAHNAAWVRRDSDQEFSAFATYCTHVGCPIRWEESASLFLCPCHGGAFYADGTVAAGPPPRPLDRFPIRVRNGTVELRTVGVPDPDE